MTEARVNGVDPAGGCDTTTLVSFWPDGRLVALRPVEMPPGVKGAMFRGYHPRFGWRYLRLRARGREGVDQVWDITEEWARYHLRRIKGGQRDRALQAARARLRDERRARSRRLHVAEADGVIRPERLAKGDVAREVMAERNGADALVWRVPQSIARLERGGSISAGEAQAARDFGRAWHLAGMAGIRAADMGRAPGGRGSGEPAAALDAKDEVYGALDHLGGLTKAGARAVAAIAGDGLSVAQWREDEAARGRHLQRKTALGIAVCALAALEAYYRLRRKARFSGALRKPLDGGAPRT